MFAGILIIVLSVALFIYWFRYSCMLLLRNHVEQAEAAQVPLGDRFSVGAVMERLKTGDALDPLHESLNRDYKILTYLVEHAAGLEMQSIENRLLVFDYRLMQAWYRVTRTAAPVQARKALTEMASILAVLVHKMGQQVRVSEA